MERFESSPESPPTIKGMIDGLTSGILSGWVFDSAFPEQSQRFYVELDGNIVSDGIAHCYREDLVKHGFEYGKHGFFIELNLTSEQVSGKTIRLLDQGHCQIQGAELIVPVIDPTIQFKLLSQSDHQLTFLVSASVAIEQTQLLLRYGEACVALMQIDLPVGESQLEVSIPLTILDGFDDTFSLELANCPAPVWVAKEYTSPFSSPRSTNAKTSDLIGHFRHKTLDLHVQQSSGETLQNALSAYRYLLNVPSDDDAKPFNDINGLRLSYVESSTVDVTVFLAFGEEASLDGWCRTLASMLFAYNQRSFELVLVVSKEQQAELTEFMAGHDIECRFVCVDGIVSFDRFFVRLGQEAKGQYSVVVNCPVEVTSFWLDELLTPFSLSKQPPDVTTAKAISCQGDVRVPASFVDVHGQLWETERRIEADHPSLNYVKQDHRSDACVWCAPTSAFIDSVGVGSEPFVHSALNVKSLSYVRTKGLNIIYSPFSEVVSLAVMATPKRSLLDVSQKKKRVLVIDHARPSVNQDAGSYAAIQEIKLIQSLGYQVLFVDAKIAPYDQRAMYLQRLGVEVVYRPFFSSMSAVIDHYIADICAVYVTRYNVAERVLPILKRVNGLLPILFNNADLHFLRELRTALNANDPQQIHQATITRDRELSVMRQVDAILSYNDTEHAVIASHLLESRKIHSCPWVLEEKKVGLPFDKREGIAFLGGYLHAPNVEAVNFFVKEVMPLLAIKAPQITFYIYGSKMPAAFNQFVASNVKRIGFVENLDEVYHRHRIFVAPLLSGAGIKGKVLESLAYGLPTVLSSVAAEGIGLAHNISTLIADTAEQWCDDIIRLYHDEALWLRISENQRTIADSRFSFKVGQQQMKAVFSSVNLSIN